jgi:Ca-activated chloride channel homolog
VTARGRTGGGAAWEHRADAVMTDQPSATRVWARAQLRALEDRFAVQPFYDLEDRIVATSLRHGVLCRFTAFVAVDSRVVTDGSGPHRVAQPVELPSGWTPAPGAFDAAPAARLSAAGPVPARAMAPAGRTRGVGAPAGVGALRPGPAMSPPPGGPVRSPAASRPRGGTAAAGATPDGTVPGGPVPAGGAGDPREDEAAAARTDAARQVADELAELLDQAAAAHGRRWAHLSDLRTRLAGLLVALRGAGAPAEQLAGLAALVAALELADDRARWEADLDDLWSRAIEVLTGWAPDGDVALAAASTAPPGPFWKPSPRPPAGIRD